MEKYNELLNLLEKRFKENVNRHKNVKWETIYNKINNDNTLKILDNMEKTGGEPGLVIINEKFAYVDLVKESPSHRRSLCYDDLALEKRKLNKPNGSALALSLKLGLTLLNEEEYKLVQNIEKIDEKTSSWLNTPKDIRTLNGAIFGERRFNHVFISANGAESYYASRGFRTIYYL